MVLETDLVPFATYFPEALWAFVLRAGVLIAAGLLLAVLVLVFRYGPAAAAVALRDALGTAGKDWLRTSPRRIFALSKLAFREALRRRVLIVVVVFAVALLFGGWFLDPDNSRPAELYLNFVLTSTKLLSMLLAIFLATISLPQDFKNRTIYTIATKPVTALELILGRIGGFVLIGTLLLALMGGASYLFVLRAYQHDHTIAADSLSNVSTGVKTGRTDTALNHQHDIRIDADGNGWTSTDAGHRHPITAEKVDGKTRYIVGPAEELHVARMPVYGKLRFKDRYGDDKDRGISVGKEWGYQSFIEGNALPKSAAIWSFDEVAAEEFPDGLPVELSVNVFRTHIGKIDEGLRAALYVRNPITGAKSQLLMFRVKHAVLDRQFIPRKLLDEQGKSRDLFADFVAAEVEAKEMRNVEGHWIRVLPNQVIPPDAATRTVKIHNVAEIWLQCLEPQQYLGVAMPDLYLRAPDASFELNFFKAFFGIWASMTLITAFGVLFSTFLSTPVALLTTIAMMIFGFYAGWVGNLATSVLKDRPIKRDDYVYGGGPLEAMIRTQRQYNLTQDLPDTFVCNAAKELDKPILHVLRAISESTPNFNDFDNSQYLVKGFDIPRDVFLTQACRTAGYLMFVLFAGYFLLRTREVAR